MYSRVTLLEIDTMRVDIDDAAALFRAHVAPGLSEQEGYEGAVALVTPEGKGMIITFWDTEDGAQDAFARRGVVVPVVVAVVVPVVVRVAGGECEGEGGQEEGAGREAHGGEETGGRGTKGRPPDVPDG